MAEEVAVRLEENGDDTSSGQDAAPDPDRDTPSGEDRIVRQDGTDIAPGDQRRLTRPVGAWQPGYRLEGDGGGARETRALAWPKATRIPPRRPWMSGSCHAVDSFSEWSCPG
ncbi:hypothetical protein N9L68_06600 [bacterium]|nr:hypothetical protein [bacterium]